MNVRGNKRLIAALLASLGLFATAPAQASLLITIDKSTQHLTVEQDGLPLFDWPVSTGVAGRDTPSGDYKPFRMEKDHFSEEWDDAPMPHSIFFTQLGHAIHGSYQIKNLGSPASHGCVRLAPQNAATLFKLVRQEKMANTRVVVKGNIPLVAPPPVASRAPKAAPRDDDDGFTSAQPSRRAREQALRERAQQERADREAPAFTDGRYYYDRRGRRYVDERPAPEGRVIWGRDYYERTQRN